MLKNGETYFKNLAVWTNTPLPTTMFFLKNESCSCRIFCKHLFQQILLCLSSARKYMGNFTGHFDFLYFEERNEIWTQITPAPKTKIMKKIGYNTLE